MPKENMAVDVAKLDEPVLSLLAGISKEKGIDLFKVYDFSVNIDKFIEYVRELRAANPDTKIAIFMDNLPVHKAKSVKKVLT